jgi:hypothetical protein
MSVTQSPTPALAPRSLGEGTVIRLARHGVRAGVLGGALLAANSLSR